MARRPAVGGDLALEGYRMVARLAEALKDADYRVEDVSRGRDTGFDLIAYSDHLGRRRSHYIQIKATSRGVATPLIREFVERSRNAKKGDEFWLVAPTFTAQAMHLGGEAHNVRLFKFEELLLLLRHQRRRPPPPKRKVDRVVRAVVTNKQSLILMAASVVAMIDEKIGQLKGQTPNDPDRVPEHEKALSDYEALKAKVLELQAAVENFKATPAKAKEIKKTAGAFRAGVEDWWKHSHNVILSTSFGMTLFVLGTAICAQLGVPPAQGAYLSAAFAGGSSMAGAMKKIPKLAKGGE